MTDVFSSDLTQTSSGRLSNPMQELINAGWQLRGESPCPRGCHTKVQIMESPSGTFAYFAHGRMHINCREEADPVVELPPIPDQEAKLKAMLELAKQKSS